MPKPLLMGDDSPGSNVQHVNNSSPRWMTWLAVSNIACVIFLYARLDAFLDDSLRYLVNLYLFGTNIAFIYIALLRGYLLAAGISLVFVLIFLVSFLVFAVNFERPFNIFSIAQNSSVFALALMYFTARSTNADSFPKIFLRAAIIYALVYLLLCLALYADVLPAAAKERLVIEGDAYNPEGRGDRILGYLAILAFGWFCALASLRRNSGKNGLVVLALFGSCILLTNSRTFMATVLAVSLLFLLWRRPRSIYILASNLLIGICAAYVYMLMTGLNPFDYFISDSSGYVRRESWNYAAYWISQFPVLGVGNAGNHLDLQVITHQYFWPTDLGPLGILFVHGAVGLAVFAILPRLLVPEEPDFTQPNYYLHAGFTLTISQFLLYQVISPITWYGGGATIFCAWIAYVLVGRARRKRIGFASDIAGFQPRGGHTRTVTEAAVPPQL